MGRNRLTKSFICLTVIADLATCNFVFCFCVFSHVCLNRFPIKE